MLATGQEMSHARGTIQLLLDVVSTCRGLMQPVPGTGRSAGRVMTVVSEPVVALTNADHDLGTGFGTGAAVREARVVEGTWASGIRPFLAH